MARLDNNTFDDREIQRRIFDDEGFQYNRDVSANTKLTTIIASLATVIAAVVVVGVLISTLTVELQQFNTLEIAQGNVAGMSGGNKYGRNIEIDASVIADIWDGGHTLANGGTSLIWLAPTAAAVHNIASTSDVDSTGNGGALTIEVRGLPDWDTAEIADTLNMVGTNNAPTQAFVIIYRMRVLTSGATAINVGVITATATAPSATTVTAIIRAGKGQTHMAILGIPSTQTLYMKDLWASANKAGGASGLADITLWFNPNPDVRTTNYISKHTAGLQTVGTSQAPHPFEIPKPFPGPGILKIEALSGTGNMDVSAGFDYILVDN